MRGKGEGTGFGSWMASVLFGVLLVTLNEFRDQPSWMSLLRFRHWYPLQSLLGTSAVGLVTSLGMTSSISCLVVVWEIVPVLGNTSSMLLAPWMMAKLSVVVD